MPNYLICNHCHYKNSIDSERIIFCKECERKIDNNYLDWKKSKVNTSFETYIKEATTKDGTVIKKIEPIIVIKERNNFKNILSGLISNTSSEARIFAVSTIAQLILFFIISNFPTTETNLSNNSYLKDVKWNNHSITNDIKITLPFELKEAASVLPEHMHNYLSYEKCNKSESLKTFSVTIEEFDTYDGINLGQNTLTSISDEYVQNPNSYIKSISPLDHFKIKKYQSYSQYGSYLLNDSDYLFENYTLLSGNKTIKIIISYLKNDATLEQYAEIISKSILRNKDVV